MSKHVGMYRILKHPYFENYNPKSEIQKDQTKQTKISFYDKNPIEIPKNVVVENPKDMEMRKSTIKFGNSFQSSFHKPKEEKKSQMEEEI